MTKNIRIILIASLLLNFELTYGQIDNKGDEIGSCMASIRFKQMKNIQVTRGMLEFEDRHFSTLEKTANTVNNKCRGLQGMEVVLNCASQHLTKYEVSFYYGYIRTRNFINSPQDPKKIPNLEVASALCLGLVK